MGPASELTEPSNTQDDIYFEELPGGDFVVRHSMISLRWDVAVANPQTVQSVVRYYFRPDGSCTLDPTGASEHQTIISMTGCDSEPQHGLGYVVLGSSGSVRFVNIPCGVCVSDQSGVVLEVAESQKRAGVCFTHLGSDSIAVLDPEMSTQILPQNIARLGNGLFLLRKPTATLGRIPSYSRFEISDGVPVEGRPGVAMFESYAIVVDMGPRGQLLCTIKFPEMVWTDCYNGATEENISLLNYRPNDAGKQCQEIVRSIARGDNSQYELGYEALIIQYRNISLLQLTVLSSNPKFPGVQTIEIPIDIMNPSEFSAFIQANLCSKE